MGLNRFKLLFLALVLTTLPPKLPYQEKDMSRFTNWTQREWKRANVELYQQQGDFYTTYNLLIAADGLLKRGPAWSSMVSYASGIQNIEGGFWDDANNRFVLVGEDDGATPSKIAVCYHNSIWGAGTVHETVTATAGLGGKSMQNVQYWGGDLWLIGSDKHVYRGSDYTTGTLTDFDSDGDAEILFPVGDRMYLVRSDGEVERLNAADSAFEQHYHPIASLDIVYATAFRGYILLAARGDDGTLFLYRLPDRGTETPITLHETARINGTGNYPANGCLFALYNDQLYFSPGRTYTLEGATARYWIDIYTFTGSHIEPVTRLLNHPYFNETTGLIPYQDRLIYYALNKVGTTPQLKILHGDALLDLAPPTPNDSGGYIWLGTLNGQLVLSMLTDAAAEGTFHAGAGTLGDGYIITSKLDFGSPGRQKRLEQLTVILDSATTDFKTVIKYRTDDSTDWTTATTSNGTRIARATALGVSFYTLQLRIDLDDDSGLNCDHRIAAINALVTEPQ